MTATDLRNLLARGILAVLVVGAAARPATAQGFSCTEVLGFSQSWEWFTGRSLSASRGDITVAAADFLDHWQGRFEFGSSVELWGAPEFHGWEGTYVSPKPCPRADIDRVVFNVSGAERDAEQWAEDIRDVVALITEKYPSVRQVVMVPVVGGPEGQCQDVRAAQNHPTVVAAIAMVAAADDRVVAGPSPTLSDCGHYADRLGHLAPDGAAEVHAALATHFSP
jgi:hypothetical protein